ncbi:hypothetical protein [Halalkalibacter urbisdiaboli]|uniref:hypothetical protein n=1 Tax=Halalkalibacter urbisdiaboli TaxID=1960589 RepID=UPI000B449CA5|nr:hypothetical protein [Halalkalibacter urbisdiaboli]
MTEWLKDNQKAIVYLFIILLLALVACYVNIVRPVAHEKANKELILSGIEQEVSALDSTLASLESESLSAVEKQRLLTSVPLKPNVEEIIADLERTEMATDIVIDDISISIEPNAYEEEKWRHILPEDLYERLQERMAKIEDLTVSYVELTINVNGLEDNIHWFVQELEHLERTIHVQNYTFGLESEKEDRANANITIRTFYSEDFVPFVENDDVFELDYEFDADLIKRYVIPNRIGTTQETNNQMSQPVSPIPTSQIGEPLVGISPKFDVYENPYNERTIREGAQVFYVVQTGGYTSEYYLYKAVDKLVNEGFYPRVEGSNLNMIYTAIGQNESTAVSKAAYIDNRGFTSFSKAIPYQLTKEEESAFLVEAQDALTVVTEITANGLMTPDYLLTDQKLQEALTKIESYQTKVQTIINITSEPRKLALEDTVAFLSRVEQLLKHYYLTGDPSVLLESEGLMLDFALTLNGFKPLETK